MANRFDDPLQQVADPDKGKTRDYVTLAGPALTRCFLGASVGNPASPNLKRRMTMSPQGNKPTHIAFHVKEGKDKKAIWQRIGAVWAHKDGQGFRIQLDSYPVDGRIEVRVNKPKERAS